MPVPLVTVAMSVHNGASTLELAIRSILWQTCADWELLLVNDASTDGTAQILRQFHDSRIRVIDEFPQKGLAARLNQCVALARGKYVARMDADDVAYPERFEKQVQFLESHPDIDLLGHGAVFFKGEGKIIGLYQTCQCHEDICRRPWRGFLLLHPTWMGKRSWFTQHPYAEHVKKGQDQELLLRTWRNSRFASLPDCLLGYRMDKVSYAKSRVGRGYYWRTLYSQIHDGKSAAEFMRGTFYHFLGLMRDIALDLTASSGEKFRLSLRTANPVVIEQWNAVLSRLRNSVVS